MIKKLITITAVLVFLFVVVLGVGSLLLKMYLPPEKAKALVLQRLSAQFHREVGLGSVDVGLLSGLHMTSLKVSESPDFSKGTFLSSDQFSLKIALVPLLFRKVIVRQIVLKHPQVTVVRNADGKTYNFSDLTAATTGTPSTPSPAATKEAFPFVLLVSRAEIQKGALHFVDRSPAQQSVDIAPFNLRLKNFSLTSPFTVQTDMRIKTRGADWTFDFSGEANPLKRTLKIKRAILASRETKITLAGQLRNLASSKPVIDLKLDIPQVELANFAPFLTLPPEVQVGGPLSGRASLSGDQNAIDLKLNLDGAKAKIRYGSMFFKPDKVACGFSVEGVLKDLQDFDAKNIQFTLSSMVLAGKGQIHDLKGPQSTIGLHLQTDTFLLDPLLPLAPGALPKDLVLKGKNQLSADLSGTTASADFALLWDGTGLVISSGAVFAKPAGMPMNLSVKGNRSGTGKITVKDFVAHLGPNALSAVGTYETRGTQGLIQFSGKATKWSVPELAKVVPLLSPYHPTGSLSVDWRASGSVDAPQISLQTTADVAMANVKEEFYEGKNLKLQWALTEVTPDLSKVNGSASFRQGPGKILNVEKLAAASRVGKIALLPLETLAKLQKKGLLKEVNLPSLQSIPFESAQGDYGLRSGVVDVKIFDLIGKELSVFTRGTVGLAGVQPVNLAVSMTLAPGTLGGALGELVKDENGRPGLKFTVTGSMADPKVKWDVQEVGKKALQQVGKEIMKNKDVQNAVEDLQKTLKGIFR